EIEISGRLEASEAASGGVEGPLVREIATPLLVNEWGAPMYAGYVSLDEPVGALRTLPAAESDFSRGLNWQSIGYSFQWVIFGGFFLFLWWRSVRATHLDEVAERREAMQKLLGDDDPAASRTPAVETTTVPHPDKDVRSVPATRPLDEVACRTAFARFRVASSVEGIALLVLVAIMIMRYVVFGGEGLFTTTSDTWTQISKTWSPIHGLIYMIYVVLAFDVWMK